MSVAVSSILAAAVPGGLTAIAVGLLASTVPTPAYSQDFTTGQIVGTVRDQGGAPVSGITVTVTDPTIGFTSTSTTGSDGVFRFPRLRIATYTATVEAAGQTLEETIRVQAGTVQSLAFTVPTAADATSLEAITVIGVLATSTRKDPLGQEGGIVVDTDDLVVRVPLGRNITDIALLAPGVLRGDAAFVNANGGGTLPSIAGSSVAENIIYVNGFNITDQRRGLGQGSLVPFEFFQQVDIKSGGFQAEFGRTTGGVTNLVTRRGTNDFHVGSNFFYTPNGLRSDDTPDTRDFFRSRDNVEELEVNTWASGALIEDRLFFYGLVNFFDRDVDDFDNSDLVVSNDDDPRWGFNVDGVLWDDDVYGYHTVTYTHIDDRRKTTDVFFDFDRDTGVIGEQAGVTTNSQGGNIDIVKYTAVVRDWLTVSGLYGNAFTDAATSSDVSDNPAIFDSRSGTRIRRGNFTDQIVLPVDNDERTTWRADADIYIDDLLGSHRLRLGYDREKRESAEASSFSGGTRFNFFANGSGLERFDPTLPFADSEVARVDTRTTGGNFETIAKALYIQDQWTTPIDRLTLNVGVRIEDLDNKNINGDTFVKFDNLKDYRTGFTYELFEDRRSRVYGFAGRYHIPVVNNTNVRLAGSEVFVQEWFELLGLNADDTPILGEFIGTDVVSPGGVQDARTLIDQGVEAQRMQEFIIGYDQAVGQNWSFGVRGIYRDLKAGMEDSAIDRGMINFAIDNGLDVEAVQDVFGGFHQFILLNPGSDVNFFVDTADLAPDFLAFLGGDPDGDGVVEVGLSAEQLGLPKIKREYKAVELTFERAYVDGWSVQGSYVWSRLTGNTEGGVKSDIGQTDTGLTQDFDTRGLTEGTSGKLPSDHRHTFKLFGSYELTDQLAIGANFTLQSPRRFGCIGVHPTDEIAAQFGAGSFFCKLDENNRPDANAPSRLTPRGSIFKSDWTKQVDLTLSFVPDIDFAGDAQLSFRVDVFNVFDTHDVTDRQEFGEFGSGAVRDTFGDPAGFLTPRTVRLSARLEF